jgi:DNA repair exonuclease SbcCD nuclease subunit
MDAMQAAGLPVYAIRGNHDNSTPPWFLAVHPHVQHVHGVVYEPVPGLKMTAFDYMEAHEIQEAVAQIPPEVSTVLLHQTARTVINVDNAWNFDPEWLPEWVTTVFMGHIHDPVEFSWREGTRGYYGGAGHVLALGEPWEVSMMEVRLDQGEPKVTRIPLPYRRYTRLLVTDDDTLAEAVELIKTVGADDEVPPVFAVGHAGVDGVVAATEDAIAARKSKDIQQRDCYVWCAPTGSIRIDDDVVTPVMEDADIGEVLSTCTVDGELHAFVMELLTKPQTPDVIAAMRTKMGVEAPVVE